MKNFTILLVALLCAGVVGCGKSHAPKQAAAAKSETFTLNEADKMLAQPVKEPVFVPTTTVTSTPAANIIVNNEIASEGTATQELLGAASTEKPDAKAIQQALKNAGVYTGTVDGKIGPRTKNAIKEFQAKNGLTADGKVGPKTWALLRKNLESVPSSTTSTADVIKN